MREHRIGQIMKWVASCLPEGFAEKITKHSTITAVVKFEEGGQPRHKIQVTGHARDSSLDDYDQTTASKGRRLFHIGCGYAVPTSTSSGPVQRSPTTSSSTRSGPDFLSIKENIPANPYVSRNMLPLFIQSHSVIMVTKHLQQAPFQVFNQCVFNTNNTPTANSLCSSKCSKRHVIIDSDPD